MKQTNMKLAAVLVTIAFIASVLTATPVLAHRDGGDREDSSSSSGSSGSDNMRSGNSDPGSMNIGLEDEDETRDNSGPGSMNSNRDEEDEMQGETEIMAFTFDGTSQVKVEVEFDSGATETSGMVSELFDKIKALTAEEVESLLRIEEKQVGIREDMEVEIDAQKIEFELRFSVDNTEREAIADAIMDELGSITLEDLNSAIEEDEAGAEIEIRAMDGSGSGSGNDDRRLVIKIDGDKTKVNARGFSEDFMTELNDIISQLLTLLRGE